MKALANTLTTRQFQGFTVYVLGNEDVELGVVPELGARIISLKDRRTGREWLWHPRDRVELFRNNPGDDFSTGPLAGMDECLPTIQPCTWRGRELADHGEVWSRAWQVNESDWENGVLATSVRLQSMPLVFERTIELLGNTVRFDYRLTNLGAADEHFIWAVHPLLRLAEGDELELPDSTRRLLAEVDWINALSTAVPPAKCAKVFARPVCEGWAAVKNMAQGDRLEFNWDPARNDTLGLWLTAGGWNGHHHFAIEPTNGSDDSLATAAARAHGGLVAGGGTVGWELSLRVGM